MILNMCAPQLFPSFLQSSINCGAFVMLAGFIIVPIVSLLSKVKDEKMVEDAFSCYEKKVETPQRMTLGDEQ